MVVNRKVTGRASSMAGGLAMGGLVSLGATVLGAAGIAWLVNSGRLSGAHMGYSIMVLLTLGAWMGAMVAAGRVKRRRVLVCAGAGIIHFLILMSITALFFGGQYSGVEVTALMVLCGASLAILPGFRRPKGGKLPKFTGRTG